VPCESLPTRDAGLLYACFPHGIVPYGVAQLWLARPRGASPRADQEACEQAWCCSGSRGCGVATRSEGSARHFLFDPPLSTSSSSECFTHQHTHTLPQGASVLFRLPLLRQWLSMAGLEPATARNLLRRLRSPGCSTFLVPGGIAEMFLNDPDYEVVQLANRKGFCKHAPPRCGL